METNCIPVNVGDIVLVKIFESNPENVEILAVKRRYGRVNGGKDRVNPLLKGLLVNTAEIKWFDNSFVLSVVRRSSIPHTKTNIYAGQPVYPVFHGSVWEGYLEELAALALAKLPYEIDREINPDRLRATYAKQSIGYLGTVGRYGFVCRVNGPRFQKWVRKNWNRILYTVTELDEMETVRQQEFVDMAYDDMDRETLNEMLEKDAMFAVRELPDDSVEPDWGDLDLQNYLEKMSDE